MAASVAPVYIVPSCDIMDAESTTEIHQLFETPSFILNKEPKH